MLAVQGNTNTNLRLVNSAITSVQWFGLYRSVSVRIKNHNADINILVYAHINFVLQQANVPNSIPNGFHNNALLSERRLLCVNRITVPCIGN